MDSGLALQIALTGAGATAFVDLWSLLRRRLLGQPLPAWSLVGRWFAGLARGRFRNPAIAAAPPVKGEAAIGWTAHYLIGIGFATVPPALGGAAWFQEPRLVPALTLGLVTVAAPFLILQPGMGAGIAGRRTRSPAATRAQSLVTHAVFGLGLYLSAVLLRSFTGD